MKNKRTRYSKSVRISISILSSFMILLSLLCMTGGVYIWSTLGLIQHESDLSGDYLDVLPPEPDDEDVSTEPVDFDIVDVGHIPLRGNTKNITNILLLGLDGRSSYKGSRSDSMIIMSINKSKKTIKLISFLRDTAVTIPGRDVNPRDGHDDLCKMNAAYAYGGFDLLQKTFVQNFRLKLDEFIGVNFVAFPTAVDAMGGIDIELSAGETGHVCHPSQKREVLSPGFKRIGTKAGLYHLNGYQTLQYSRIRHLDSDFYRTERQRKVIEILLGKAKSMSFGTLNATLTQILPDTVTNMTMDKLLGYAMSAGTYASYTIDKGYHIPVNKEYIGYTLPGGGASLLIKDQAKAVNDLHSFIYE